MKQLTTDRIISKRNFIGKQIELLVDHFYIISLYGSSPAISLIDKLAKLQERYRNLDRMLMLSL